MLASCVDEPHDCPNKPAAPKSPVERFCETIGLGNLTSLFITRGFKTLEDIQRLTQSELEAWDLPAPVVKKILKFSPSALQAVDTVKLGEMEITRARRLTGSSPLMAPRSPQAALTQPAGGSLFTCLPPALIFSCATIHYLVSGLIFLFLIL